MCCGRSSRVQTRMLTLKLLLLPSAGLDHWQHTLRITLHLIPHPPGSQYLPTKQTLIPLLPLLSLSPADTPVAVFLHRKCGGAERRVPVRSMVAGSGAASQSRVIRSTWTRGMEASADTTRIPLCIHEVLMVSEDSQRSTDPSGNRDSTFTLQRQMGSCAGLSFISSVSR